MKPKISIITPSLNQGKYIEKAILSVIEQNYENLEYIIVDGGSTDNTLEVIRKYENKIAYFISEPDLGQTDAINKGLRIATGEIFTWLNADDFYEPQTFNRVAKQVNLNPGKDIFCGMANVIGVNGTIQRQTNGVIIHKTLTQTIGWPVINQPETFFRREIIEKTGLLSISLRYNMDKELWIKYLLVYGQNKIFKISELWVNFLHHDSSKSINEVSEFTPERDVIFLGIAKWANLGDIVSFLTDKLNINDTHYSFYLDTKTNERFVREVFQYFMLLKGDEYYVSGDYVKMKLCLDRINPLEVKESTMLYFKLKFKAFLLWVKNRSTFLYDRTVA